MITLESDKPRTITVLEIDEKLRHYNGEILFKKNGMKRFTGGILSNVKYFVRQKKSEGFLIKG